MPKTKISEFSATPANNTDIDSINIAEGCAPSGINDAIRELMAQLKDFQTGAVGDSFNGPVGTTTAAAGAFTTLSASGAVTLSGGTANGVAYLNGSKVVTSGSALTFNGSTLAVNAAGESFSIQSSNTSNYFTFKQSGTQVGDIGYDGRDTNALSVWNNINGPMIFGVNASEGMRLTSTGLGIGTSSPATKLQVYGGALTVGNESTYAARFGNNSNKGVTIGYDTTNNVGHIGSINPAVAWTDLVINANGGNLGLGVTPSAWQVNNRALQLLEGYASISSNNSQGCCDVAANCFNGGSAATSGWKYTNSGSAVSLFQQQAGAFKFLTAGSGTAGNAITFTQAMTLDASGNLLVGTTSNADSRKLRVYGISEFDGSGVGLTIYKSSGTKIGSSGQGDYVVSGGPSDGYGIQSQSSLVFGSGGTTERARINSSGNLLVGTTSTSFEGITVAKASATYLNVYGNTSNDGGLLLGGDGIENKANVIYKPSLNALQISANAASSYMYFNTAGNERARIDTSGNLLVGTTTAYAKFASKAASGQAAGWFGVATNGDAGIFFANASNTTVGSITVNSSTTAYNTSSDYRLKNTIAPMTGALAKVAQLKPVTYKWNVDGSDGQGFIAHELAEVVPQCVTGEKDAVDADGNPQYQGIDTSFLVATLTAAIQELKAEFDAYKASHP